MASIGQAQANASHLAEFARALRSDGVRRLLVAGAGPGHFLEFAPPDCFNGLTCVFTDINPAFLAALRNRMTDAVCAADDLEQSGLKAGAFDGASATLVLEHTEWRRVVKSLSMLAPRVMIVIQQNPSGQNAAVSPNRTPPGSMSVFKTALPALVDEEELAQEMDRHGFKVAGREPSQVADGKTMLALTFRRD